MGSGSYSDMAYRSFASSRNYAKSSISEIFSRSMDRSNSLQSFNTGARAYNKVKDAMTSVGIRECRDSEEHPNVTPIIIAFDVTGSMGRIPHLLIKDQLPKIMNFLQEVNVPDPQVMFMAIGDHYSDDYPIQTGQFEADTEKILNTLQSLYLERGGGGNGGESYSLAWLIAGYHTETDSWYKRHKKGFLFTIGDEPIHPTLESEFLVKGLGYEKGAEDISTPEALFKAKEQYHVFHIHVTDGCYSLRAISASWKELLGDNLLSCDSSEISTIISSTIQSVLGKDSQQDTNQEKASPAPSETETTVNKKVL